MYVFLSFLKRTVEHDYQTKNDLNYWAAWMQNERRTAMSAGSFHKIFHGGSIPYSGHARTNTPPNIVSNRIVFFSSET